MPIQYSWLVEGRIILLEAIDQITLQDIQAEDEIMRGFFSQSNAPLIHVLADETRPEKMPDLKSFAASNWVKDPRVGWFILYGLKHKFLRFVLTVGAQLFRLRTRIFDTREEAIDFLQNIDDTLPDLTQYKQTKSVVLET